MSKMMDVLDQLEDVTVMTTYMSVTIARMLDNGELPSEEMTAGATKIFDCIREKLRSAMDDIKKHAVVEDGQ